METCAYAGSELPLFALATHWKKYWRHQIAQYVTGTVLEVGAGDGNNTIALAGSGGTRWVCLEPDVSLCVELRARLATVNSIAAAKCEIVAGTLETIAEKPLFDTILYLDVLEHIQLDRRELALSARALKPGGHLIVLCPAHAWLYSPFDKAVGHFRRYSRKTLCSAGPEGMRLVRCRYLDCAGLAASSANALLLRRSLPTRRQILVWDRCLVPVSRWVDRLLGYACGKSVLGVWRNRPA